MASSRSDWFPTPVWHFKGENYEQMNNKLCNEIKEERSRNSKGEQRSNILGWHSVDNLHHRESFKDFIELVNHNVKEIASFLQWDFTKFRTSVTTCWANVNGKFSSNSIHTHPNSILSGVYYVKAPANCGGLFFSDPRPAARMIMPPLIDLNAWTAPRVTYEPIEGSMILFPSWLPHGVEVNLSREERISISFNLAMRSLS